jgi:hypothetical protein
MYAREYVFPAVCPPDANQNAISFYWYLVIVPIGWCGAAHFYNLVLRFHLDLCERHKYLSSKAKQGNTNDYLPQH